MKDVTTANPKALIGGIINTDNELLTIEDVQEFLKQCAECIGEQFAQHSEVKKLSFTYYLKDGRQQFTEEEIIKLDGMVQQCEVLCEELHDYFPDLVADAIQGIKGLMTRKDAEAEILGIIHEAIDICNVVSVEENAGSNYITMGDGKVYFIMVSECEQEGE